MNEPTPPTVFTITRSKWLRGEGSDDSALLRASDSKMCCLGQVGEQCGIPREVLSGATNLCNLGLSPVSADNIQAIPDALKPLNMGFWKDNTLARNMMSLNDAPVGEITEGLSSGEILIQSEEFREAKLTELAAAEGITLIFVD